MYTNECPNIFVQTKLIRTNVRIIMCAQYIQISEYIGHRLVTLCSKVSSKKGINWKFSKNSQSQNVMSVYQVFFVPKSFSVAKTCFTRVGRWYLINFGRKFHGEFSMFVTTTMDKVSFRIIKYATFVMKTFVIKTIQRLIRRSN